MLPERGVGRMPDTLPTEDAALRFDLRPFGIKRVTPVAKPLRTELPVAAAAATLHQKPVSAQSRPVRRGQAIRLSHRNWQPRREIGSLHLAVHSTASEPRSKLLTGVTIGPPI